MTLYVVLKNNGEAGWEHHGTHEARSAPSAIRTHVERAEQENASGEYVATPLRSWKPVTVKVETKTALRFS